MDRFRGHKHRKYVCLSTFEWIRWVVSLDRFNCWVQLLSSVVNSGQLISSMGRFNGSVQWFDSVDRLNGSCNGSLQCVMDRFKGSVQWIGSMDQFNGPVQ